MFVRTVLAYLSPGENVVYVRHEVWAQRTPAMIDHLRRLTIEQPCYYGE